MSTFTNNQKILITKAREATGKLFYSVISGAITPFEATKYFPKNVDDVSLKIAWHALLHFDADEEIRAKDFEYAQEQLKYIELLAKILSQGKELPANMLDVYENLSSGTVLPKTYNWWGKLTALFRFID
ncbi:MAG: hypothetical protein MJ180_03965 [Candidatus Gastranaerophilales bacterium]|nr:hypothetical protein [Candidatus Gastranaerophilales bacterium]